jgi:hypothetical protein
LDAGVVAAPSTEIRGATDLTNSPKLAGYEVAEKVVVLVAVLALVGFLVGELPNERTQPEAAGSSTDSSQVTATPAPTTPESLLQAAVDAFASGDVSLSERNIDELLERQMQRDVNADIEQFPALTDVFRTSWSRVHDVVPFSIIQNRSDLGPNYTGSDFEVIYERLSTALPITRRRAETETKEEFEAHLADLNSRPLKVGPFTATAQPFVFAGKLQSWMNYDPDSQTVRWGMYNDDKGKFGVSDKFSIFGDDAASVPIDKTTEFNGSYTGENAFGVKRRITDTTTNRSILFLKNVNELEWEKLSFAVPRDQWNELKPQLRSLYAVMLVDPIVSVKADFSTATISNPNVASDISRIISGRLVEYWVYRNDTGEILARLSSTRQ